jgi:hypothetical protein
MEDNKNINTTVVDSTTGTIVNTENAAKTDAAANTHKHVGRPKKIERELVLDLTKYENNVKLAIAHAKMEAGMELNHIDKEAIKLESEAKQEVENIFTKIKNFFKNIVNKISNWIKK